ncbi:MAG: ATP-binding protein [Planctomycetes bacterium]|nr:ATP-binding protein [Planctomycetota bacterium]
METIRRFFQAPAGSFFLFGPRGTGKTTFLNQAFPDALRIDLLSPAEHRSYLARPERLEDLIAANPAKNALVIDEVQKAPGLLDVVHKMMDLHPALRFIMTGSSSRKLKRVGVDLLAGRAIPTVMHPFLASELGNRFVLADNLKLGMVPLVLDAREPGRTLAGYVSIYLKEEVQEESLARNFGNFARFLEAMAFSHASVLNASEVARECEINRKTVEGYLAILEDLLLGFRLPIFSRRAKRILIQHAKFYYFDCGVFRSVRPMGPLDRSEEAEGAALEGLLAQHLKAWVDYRDKRDGLYFWRTKSGLEVDFVVYGEDTFAAIEVKNRRRVDSKDTRSLREFASDYPEAETRLLYRGKERIEVAGVLCIPCEEFLAALHPGRPLV